MNTPIVFGTNPGPEEMRARRLYSQKNRTELIQMASDRNITFEEPLCLVSGLEIARRISKEIENGKSQLN